MGELMRVGLYWLGQMQGVVHFSGIHPRNDWVLMVMGSFTPEACAILMEFAESVAVLSLVCLLVA